MQTALVTGANGFIGSHLVEYLYKCGFKVRAMCEYNSNGSWGWIDTFPMDLKSDLDVVLGDIRDPQFVKKSMKGCDIVFHLAALISIPYSYEAPSSYVDTNIHGTLNVLNAAKELEISKIVHTSTSETYGTAQFIPIREDHPMVGQSPYAATKIAADQLALSFYRSFGTPVTIFRPFNTYGPRQSTRAVIPTVITQIASGMKSIRLGSLTPTRDFNFVLDTCAAFKAVAISEETIGKVINSASNFEISIADTVKIICSIMNSDVEIISDYQRIRPEKSEVNRLFGDNTLLKTLTDWSPQFSGLEGFNEGLRITAEWFSEKSNLKKYSANIYLI